MRRLTEETNRIDTFACIGDGCSALDCVEAKSAAEVFVVAVAAAAAGAAGDDDKTLRRHRPARVGNAELGLIDDIRPFRNALPRLWPMTAAGWLLLLFKEK